MKKILLGLMAVLMLSALLPSPSWAGIEIKKGVATSDKTITQKEADVLIDRLNEINEMDKSSLSSSEKKELRNEILSIKSQLLNSPVLIISGGALLLLIILLIILL